MIELFDFAYALENGDLPWLKRSLKRFPALREGADVKGRPFRQLAERAADPVIMTLFRKVCLNPAARAARVESYL